MEREDLNLYACMLREYLMEVGMGETWAAVLNMVLNTLIVAVLATFLDIVFRKIVVQLFKAFSDKTTTTFDDFLVKSNFPRFIAHFLPLSIVWYLIPSLFQDFPNIEMGMYKIAQLYLVLLCVLVFRSILRTTNNYLNFSKEKYSDKPLESYVQVLMIFAWGVALIFKDTILGFVASIQVSVNDIVRIGDWITFSKFGADGYVTEINLATVRVQNFDNTFTTIPTYSLIADSFQNWRGMQESEGRRIKRSLFIKQNSIRFLSSEELEDLKKIQLIAPYIEHREKDVLKYNRATEADKSLLINGRNQTNLGIFRKYADAFLHENPAINKDLFLMVRHLAPTDKGIPLEIFCFCYDKRWENYEHIQADIFDHLISAIPYFGLELFESPTGTDFAKISLNKQ